MFKLNTDEIEFIKNNEIKFKEYLGKKSNYYLSAWTIKPKYNMASTFGGIFWFGYRGMFLYLFVIFILFIVFDLSLALLGISYKKSINYGFLIIYGMVGNYLFYYKVKNNILKNKKPTNHFLGIFVAFIMFCFWFFISILLEETVFNIILLNY